MITYDWNCRTVDAYTQEKGKTNVVYNVHWIVTGTQEDYSATNIGTQVVPLSEGGDFIPLEDLTNEIIVGWTKDAIGEEQVKVIETSIASQIEEQINPKHTTITIDK